VGGPETLGGLRDEILAHGGCGYEPCETASRCVPGEGNPRADVVFVGEAPGATEDTLGRPFVGRAGRLLDELLAAAGVSRDDVWITNVVKARPPKNRDPRAPEIAHWMPFLERELEIIAPRYVVPLGRHALKHFAPSAKIADVHGKLVDGRLFPLYHPAAAMYNQTLRAALFDDARALGALLRV
jgi:uracil-DNA glycosylase